ncbi:MAG: tetratricopeptide repeat protein [bacterium]|nr:tetratricopeptide repeat protein [Candidatus Kapabacteria bacterium]
MSSSTQTSTVATPAQLFLDHERREHEAFAASRRRVYVRQREPLDAIDRFVDEAAASSRGSILLATGDSGTGKSALLANWAHGFRTHHPQDFVIEHYVGSSSRGSTHIELIRRVMLELNERFEISGTVPVTPSSVEEEFPLWLAKVKDRTVFVLDGLDQLEEGSDCSWLPEYMPGRITIIASARKSPSSLSVSNQNWTELPLPPLSRADRQEIVSRHLPASLGEPNRVHLDRMTSHAASTNPLFLCTGTATVLSDDGVDVKDRIDKYLAANDLDDLFEQILVRIEEKHGVDNVRNAVVPLCLARRGLTQDELKAVAGKRVPNVDAIVSSIDLHTIRRNDIIAFSHELFRSCASSRYLKNDDEIRSAHKKLGKLFASQQATARTADEAPWHWMRAGEWKSLTDCLCDRETLHFLSVDDSQFDLLRYWRAAGEHFDPFESYEAAIEKWNGDSLSLTDLSCAIEEVGALLTKQGRYDEARAMYERALSIRENAGSDVVEHARVLHQLGELYYHSGSVAESERYMRSALDMLDSAVEGDRDLRAKCVGDLAALLFRKSELAEAERLLNSARIAAEKNGDSRLLAECFNNLGSVYISMNKEDRADEMFRAAIRLNGRVLGADHPDVARSMLNLAKLEMQRGNLTNAESTARAALDILDAVLGPSHLSTMNGRAHLANIIYKSGNATLAEEMLTDIVDRARKRVGAELLLAGYLANLGSIQKRRGAIQRAREAYGECVSIRTSHLGESHPDTVHARTAESSLAEMARTRSKAR